MTMYITRGVPASGKSTYAKAWAEAADNRIRVSRDDIRRMMFVTPKYTWEQEQRVSAIERHAVEDALVANCNVIIDAMHLRASYITAWRKLAKAYGTEVEFVDFPISLEEALRRDATRTGVEHIGEKFITETFQKFIKKDGTLRPPPKDVTEEIPAHVRYEGTPDKPDTIIFDIDGTLALNTGGRNIYDLTRVHEDTPFVPVVQLLEALSYDGYKIVYCSGRSADSRAETELWIKENVTVPGPLFMRPSGDFRKDSIVKRELFDTYIRDNYNVVSVFDDRDQVVKMWRDLGIQTNQVQYGDF